MFRLQLQSRTKTEMKKNISISKANRQKTSTQFGALPRSSCVMPTGNFLSCSMSMSQEGQWARSTPEEGPRRGPDGVGV
jgi:hypothetical protein